MYIEKDIEGQKEMHSYRAGLSAWLSFLFTSLAVSAVLGSGNTE